MTGPGSKSWRNSGRPPKGEMPITAVPPDPMPDVSHIMDAPDRDAAIASLALEAAVQILVAKQRGVKVRNSQTIASTAFQLLDRTKARPPQQVNAKHSGCLNITVSAVEIPE